MKFDVPTAQAYALQGRLEDWVQAYLLGGPWANPQLADGLKLQQRWWRGPLELPLERLARAVGPEQGMEYQVKPEDWQARTARIAAAIRANQHTPLDMPPLIAMYAAGALSVRDGNHRHGAYARLGWRSAWVLIWYNSQEDFLADQV